MKYVVNIILGSLIVPFATILALTFLSELVCIVVFYLVLYAYVIVAYSVLRLFNCLVMTDIDLKPIYTINREIINEARRRLHNTISLFDW